MVSAVAAILYFSMIMAGLDPRAIQAFFAKATRKAWIPATDPLIKSGDRHDGGEPYRNCCNGQLDDKSCSTVIPRMASVRGARFPVAGGGWCDRHPGNHERS